MSTNYDIDFLKDFAKSEGITDSEGYIKEPEPQETDPDYLRLALLSPEKGFNEIKMAEIFGKLYRDRIRYNTTSKGFCKYNGKYWESDCGNVYAKTIAKDFHGLLMKYAFKAVNDTNIREPFVKFCNRYSGKRTRDALLDDSITELAISENDFDKDLNLFNVRNGTINLDTLQLQPHNPNDLITNYSDTEYIQGAKSALWDKFISDVLVTENGYTDKDLVAFVQKMYGYALTGNPELERMFILYGATTRNGKGTLTASVLNVFGTYQRTMLPTTLQARATDSAKASEDIARLATCRLVSCSETPQGMIFDAALLKTLTGNDIMTARRLFENSFEFKPKFSIFMNTNHLPKVIDTTIFDSDRVNIIPFNRHFSADERDETLKNKLMYEESKSAILNWLIDGLKKYRSEGLKLPMSVSVATRLYEKSNDKLMTFLDETYEPLAEGEYKSLTLTACYDTYKQWCSDCGYSAEGRNKFAEKLRAKQLLAESVTIDGKTVKRVICGYGDKLNE